MTVSFSGNNLLALEKRVRLDLETIEFPLRPWVLERRDPAGDPIADVVIVGAGLSGLSIAFGLLRNGVHRIRIIDAAPAGQEGPWITSARMRTLRSPKTMTGPDLGIPSLTYRAWHEACFGPDHWHGLDKIDRKDWMAYLVWFRRIVGIAVENDTRLTDIRFGGGHLQLQLDTPSGDTSIACRKLVLATGIDGAGGHHIPAGIADGLPRDRWAHSGEVVDISTLAGRDVGIIGAAASSFDWAVAALEADARSVTVLARGRSMPRTEVLDWSNFPGFLNHFADLDDTSRYRFTRQMLSFKAPPTVEMFTRAMRDPRCSLLQGAPAMSANMDGEQLRVVTPAGDFRFDMLLLGTGYTIDLHRRPELAGIVDAIATWRDRFTPAREEADGDLLSYPYLGSSFQLTEKRLGQAPFLKDIHLFNNGAVPSMGPVCNGITGLKAGVPRLVASLMRDLFLEDADEFYRSLQRFDKVHFDPPGFLI